MTATFNWTIPQCDRELSDGGITTAHWRVTASQTVQGVDYAVSSYGTCGFTPDPSASDWTVYAEVTEIEVLGWCFANGVDKDQIQTSLQAEIDAKITPSQAAGVPWS